MKMIISENLNSTRSGQKATGEPTRPNGERRLRLCQVTRSQSSQSDEQSGDEQDKESGAGSGSDEPTKLRSSSTGCRSDTSEHGSTSSSSGIGPEVIDFKATRPLSADESHESTPPANERRRRAQPAEPADEQSGDESALSSAQHEAARPEVDFGSIQLSQRLKQLNSKVRKRSLLLGDTREPTSKMLQVGCAGQIGLELGRRALMARRASSISGLSGLSGISGISSISGLSGIERLAVGTKPVELMQAQLGLATGGADHDHDDDDHESARLKPEARRDEAETETEAEEQAKRLEGELGRNGEPNSELREYLEMGNKCGKCQNHEIETSKKGKCAGCGTSGTPTRRPSDVSTASTRRSQARLAKQLVGRRKARR